MTVVPLVRFLVTDFLFCLYLCVLLLQFVMLLLNFDRFIMKG